MILNSFYDWAEAQLINPVLGIWGFWHAAGATPPHASLSCLWSPWGSNDLYPYPPPKAHILAWLWDPRKAGPKFCLLVLCLTYICLINQYVFSAHSVQVLSLRLDHRGCAPCCIFPFYHLSWASPRLRMERVLQKLLEHWIHISSATELEREFQSWRVFYGSSSPPSAFALSLLWIHVTLPGSLQEKLSPHFAEKGKVFMVVSRLVTTAYTSEPQSWHSCSHIGT